ncbi:efflux RND transporter periplasmic adaptor subunit [soil metagenome]
MKRWMKWLIPSVVVVLIAGVIGNTVRARKQEQANASAAIKAPLQLELMPADVLTLRVQPLTRTLDISGGLKAVNTAIVRAKVAAEVKVLRVREGDTVKAGEVIGQLDTTEFEYRVRQAEQTAVSARTQLDIAKRALDNNRALVAQGFISPTGLESSVSTEAGARAAYQAAQAATDLARKSRADAVLVAPISGVVSQRLANPGERVAIDAKIIEVVDLSRIEMEAAVAPDDVGDVHVGQTARLQVDGLSQPATATVARINPSTQSGTRAVMVYLALQDQPGLRQGLFAKGNIAMQRKEALAVPVSAVRVDQAQPYVAVVQDGKVVQHTVALGVRGNAIFDGRQEAAVELVSGIADGSVVLRGTAGQVRDGTPVKLMKPTADAAVATSVAKPASGSTAQ